MQAVTCLNDRFICIEGTLFCFSWTFFQSYIEFLKDCILVHRAIPKSQRLEYLPSLLDFGPQGNTQIS